MARAQIGIRARPEPHFRIGWRVFKSNTRVLVGSMLVLWASWVGLEATALAVAHVFADSQAAWLVSDVLLHLA